MAEVPDELEIDRLRNLVVGFGWEISRQEFKTDKIIITLEKERKSTEEPASPGPG